MTDNLDRIWMYLFLTLTIAKSSGNEGTSMKVSELSIKYATRTSLRVEAHVKGGEYCKTYSIGWRYTKDNGSLDPLQNFTYMESNQSWPSANGVRQGKISELEPETSYRIHAIIVGCQNIQWQEEVIAFATTCPNIPQKTSHVLIENVEANSFVVMWQIPEKSCVSTFYYINVFEYSDTAIEISQSNNCPDQGLSVKNTPYCEKRKDYLCYHLDVFPVESTQYGIEVWTTDDTGICTKGANIAYVKINIGETYWSVIEDALKLSGLYCSIFLMVVFSTWLSVIVINNKLQL